MKNNSTTTGTDRLLGPPKISSTTKPMYAPTM